ncbi:MAG TPA: hypothetical protein VFK02_34005, partial [Kofleriaceae bacterium]|nr:hypothetical protein [Kofleriaceae bacterium]
MKETVSMLVERAQEMSTGSNVGMDRLPEWKEVDRRLRAYAHHRSELDAAELFDLVRAEQLKVHVCCGCSSLY